MLRGSQLFHRLLMLLVLAVAFGWLSPAVAVCIGKDANFVVGILSHCRSIPDGIGYVQARIEGAEIVFGDSTGPAEPRVVGVKFESTVRADESLGCQSLPSRSVINGVRQPFCCDTNFRSYRCRARLDHLYLLNDAPGPRSEWLDSTRARFSSRYAGFESLVAALSEHYRSVLDEGPPSSANNRLEL